MLDSLVMEADGVLRENAGAIERSLDSSVGDINPGKSFDIRVPFQRPPGGEWREKDWSFIGGRRGIGRDSVDIHGLH